MHLYIQRHDSINTIFLPDIPEGRFAVEDIEGSDYPLMEVCGGSDGWYLQSNHMMVGERKLKVNELHELSFGEEEEKVTVYLSEDDKGCRHFARCRANMNCTVTVGSAGDNELICKQKYMSAHHMEFTCKGGIWQVKCLSASQCVYVNGSKIKGAVLAPGDVVSVYEQKFILLPGVLAFNSPLRETRLREGSVFVPLDTESLHHDTLFVPTPVKEFFHRAPRFMSGLERKSMTVDSPPAPHEPSQTNAILNMAPGLLTGAVSLAIATNPLLPLATMAGATIFPMLSRKLEGQKVAEEEAKRVEAYKTYIADIEAHIADVTAKQERQMRINLPPTEVYIKELLQEPHRLWSRNSEQLDYLDIPIGTGEIDLEYDITFPQDRFEIQSDPMKQLIGELKGKERKLKNVPIVLPLSKFNKVGVAAEARAAASLIGNIILRLAIDYGYDEMKFVLIGKLPEGFEDMRWLPHTWSNDRKEHYIAETTDELYRLQPCIDRMLVGRETVKDNEIILNGEPELIFIIFDPEIAQSGMMSRQLYDHNYRGVRVFSAARNSYELPRRCNSVITIEGNDGSMVYQDETRKATVTFKPEKSALSFVSKLSKKLGNMYLDLPDTAARIPESLSFLDMFGVSDVESLNVASRWMRSQPHISLAAPIGIDEDGKLCCLDVHERSDGQHGLIAGMTGSGKSEFIMTYILSLATCFSPEDVSFLLIDYKGGGMAAAFKDLPHTAGIITNLDGNNIKRSLMAIQSELRRRQEIFHQTEQELDITGLNIIKYQKLYKERRIGTPLPHLLIITDEFAELKTQEPEFMDSLISASRIGRSLGIHLILATQKPSGVVDDQIWSNTNWRVCLKVQDSADSRDVIKCPDAASISTVGRFYMQVGYGILRLAQSGYTGAPYQPTRKSLAVNGVEAIDELGQVIARSEIPTTNKKSKLEYQINVLVQYLKKISERHKLKCQPVWLEPLEDNISLLELERKYAPDISPYTMNIVIGEIDNPALQCREPVFMNLADGRNTILYGANGSGKARFIGSMLEGLMKHHSPDELNIYMLDYADDSLSDYMYAPQVGDVLSPQEDEKLVNLLRMLILEVERRKKIVKGGMNDSTLAEKLRDAKLPNILVIVHNIAILKERLEDDLTKLIKLMGEGPRYGVSFVATAVSPGGIGYKLQDTFANRYVLQLDKADDYSLLLGRTRGMTPSAVRGRGLIMSGEILCEYQTAFADFSVQELCQQQIEKYPGISAPQIRVLPERVTAEYLAGEFSYEKPMRLPVGIDRLSLDPVYLDLEKSFVHLIMAGKEDAGAMISEMLTLLTQTERSVIIWGSDMIRNNSRAEVRYIPVSESAGFIRELFAEMAAQKNPGAPELKEKLIIMPMFKQTADQLKSSGGNEYEMLTVFLEKLKTSYKCTFIICGNQNELNLHQYETWFKQQINTEEGIYLGMGISSQNIFSVNGVYGLAKQEKPVPFGFIISGGNPRQVKFLSDRSGTEGGY